MKAVRGSPEPGHHSGACRDACPYAGRTQRDDRPQYKTLENLLRRMLRRRGHSLVKSRIKDARSLGHGGYNPATGDSDEATYPLFRQTAAELATRIEFLLTVLADRTPTPSEPRRNQ